MDATFPGRKQALLVAIVKHARTHNYGMTMDELADIIGVTNRSSVFHHITDLEAAGLVSRTPRKRRGIKPTEKGKLLAELVAEDELAEASS